MAAGSTQQLTHAWLRYTSPINMTYVLPLLEAHPDRAYAASDGQVAIIHGCMFVRELGKCARVQLSQAAKAVFMLSQAVRISVPSQAAQVCM